LIDSQDFSPRRTNLVFRQLIDEMLKQLRDTSTTDAWTPEERARAEADLARIMESVRREALRDR
jgi:hypothetical protein